MDRMKVSKWRKTKIKSWLKLVDGKQSVCPFKDINGVLPSHKFCYSWFPKAESQGDFCPCSEYSLAHVIRTAKIMIKSGV